jgi:glycosyltransferase involved in cell wall biosynthesis
MFLSVIVPVGRSEPGLERCVSALLCQEFRADDFEIILCPYDSGQAHFHSLPVSSRIRFAQPCDGDIYAAKNAGAALAQSEAFLFIHPHCVADPTWLRSMACGIERFDALLGYCAFESTSRAMNLLERYENHKAKTVCAGDVVAEYFAYSNNLALTRSAFEIGGRFPEGMPGGASVLIQNLASAKGCQSIEFCSAARVVMLPLTGLGPYFRKRFQYGAHYTRLRQRYQSSYRHLGNARRTDLFGSLCNDGQLGFWDQATLAVLLALGWSSFEAGRVWARLG